MRPSKIALIKQLAFEAGLTVWFQGDLSKSQGRGGTWVLRDGSGDEVVSFTSYTTAFSWLAGRLGEAIPSNYQHRRQVLERYRKRKEAEAVRASEARGEGSREVPF